MYSLELFIDFTLTERTFLDIVAKSEIIQPFVEQIVITFSWVALSENLSQDCYSYQITFGKASFNYTKR